MQEINLKEHFVIPILEYKTVDIGKSKIRIKGIALKGGVTSKNNREYVASELKKACNTWIGKPVNINHNNNIKAGHITWMDYDEYGDFLTYEAEINKQPYVDLIRNRSSEIRGMSIQADYLFNRCYKCGEKLYSESDFDAHMWTKHFMHTDAAKTQPHGIIGNGIALVLSPEVPGYDGTTVELAETARLQTLRLLETVINERKEINEMTKNKAVVTPISRVTIDRAKQIKEDLQEPDHPVLPAASSDPEEEQAETLPESTTPTPEQPETKVTEQLECPAGYHPEGEECVMDDEEPAEETVEENPENQLPVPHPVPAGHTPAPTEDESETLPETNITVPPQPEIKVMETKLPKLLHFGIEDNSLDAQVKEMYDQPKAYRRDIELANTVNSLTEAIAQLNLTTSKNMKSFSETFHNTLTEIAKHSDNTQDTQSKIYTKQLTAIKETVTAIQDSFNKKIEALTTINNKKLSNLATEVAKRDLANKQSLNKKLSEIKMPDLKPLQEELHSVKQEFTAKLNEQSKIKETFEQLLNTADKNAAARDSQIKSLEERLEESNKKKLQETQALEARVDNMEDKIKPQYKAHSTRITETVDPEDKPYIPDPNTKEK